MKIEPNLIFDAGMHIGQDTEYYLSKGYKVVAIEANPDLCNTAKEKFSEQIKHGQLIIENTCVGNQNKQVEFHINDNVTEKIHFILRWLFLALIR